MLPDVPPFKISSNADLATDVGLPAAGHKWLYVRSSLPASG
jgi:hypothetical protein